MMIRSLESLVNEWGLNSIDKSNYYDPTYLDSDDIRLLSQRLNSIKEMESVSDQDINEVFYPYGVWWIEDHLEYIPKSLIDGCLMIRRNYKDILDAGFRIQIPIVPKDSANLVIGESKIPIEDDTVYASYWDGVITPYLEGGEVVKGLVKSLLDSIVFNLIRLRILEIDGMEYIDV